MTEGQFKDLIKLFQIFMDYYGVYKNEGRYNDILDEIEHVYEALKEEKEAPRF